MDECPLPFTGEAGPNQWVEVSDEIGVQARWIEDGGAN